MCSRMLSELGLKVAKGVLEAAHRSGAAGATHQLTLDRVPGDVPLPHSFYSNAPGMGCTLAAQ